MTSLYSRKASSKKKYGFALQVIKFKKKKVAFGCGRSAPRDLAVLLALLVYLH
jgi:hypothetical protein